MTVDGALELLKSVLWICMRVAGPPVLAALVVGVVVGILQTATQIQEASITFIMKLLGVSAVMIALGPEVIRQLIEYTRHSIGSISEIVR
jgi:flagellar biosynthetic protein FliQ